MDQVPEYQYLLTVSNPTSIVESEPLASEYQYITDKEMAMKFTLTSAKGLVVLGTSLYLSNEQRSRTEINPSLHRVITLNLLMLRIIYNT